MTYQFITLNGTKIHYHEQGSGPPLVLIHSGVADLRLWDDQMADFSRHHRVIRYDVRGYGRTPHPPGEYADHDDLRALLDHLSVEKAVILGCSMGGSIAIDFSLAYPERVMALIPIGAALSGYEPAIDDQIDEQYQTLNEQMELSYEAGDFRQTAHLLAKIWVDGPNRTPEQVDPTVRQRAMAMMSDLFQLPDDEGTPRPLDPPAARRLAELSMPTMVVVGDQDVEPIMSLADVLTDQIQGAKKVMMTGVAHYPNMERPAEFNRIILDFLASV